MSLEYFGHDYGARTDPKLVKLRMKHGWAAVGIYWALVEVMHEQCGRIAQADIDALIYDLRFDVDITTEVLNEAFTLSDGFYTSSRVNRNLEQRQLKSEIGKNAAKIRWNHDKEQCDGNANALHNSMPTQCEPNAIKKERKKERKDITPCRAQTHFIKPTLEQVITYAKEIRANINPQAFLDHYESNGWKVGKNPMKSWQAAVRTWKHNGLDNTPLPAQSAKEGPSSAFSPKAIQEVEKLVAGIGKDINA